MKLKFGSVCSGIEAASVAWEPLGWRASWFAEIEAFPSAVLAYRFPNTLNLGDMTKIAEMVRMGFAEDPDVLVGGTPCQAFSVAGSRQSLDDERGQLSLSFITLANTIDEQRVENGKDESIVVWENVPGVLNTKDNAFGCFLGELSGAGCELQPSGKKWTNSGCVFGPQRTVAWRVLDAQYFRVAQRRRRVFVVASARKGFNPAKVLFESESLRRDTAPSRSAGQEVTRSSEKSPCIASGKPAVGTLMANAGTKLWLGNQEAFSGDYFVIHDTQDPITQDDQAFPIGRNQGQENAVLCDLAVVNSNCFQQNTRNEVRLLGGDGEIAGALMSQSGMKQQNYVAPCFGIPGNWIGRKPENGGNATEPMDNIAPCQTKTDKHAVVYGIQGSMIGRNDNAGPQGSGLSDNIGFTLTKGDRHAVAYAFDSLSSNSMKSSNPHSGCREVDLAKTLDTTDPNPSKNQGGIAIVQSSAVDVRNGAVNVEGPTMTLQSGGIGQGRGMCINAIPHVFCGTQNDACRDVGEEIAPTLRAGNGGGTVNQIVNTIPLNSMTMLGRPSDDLKPRMGLGVGSETDPQNTLTKNHHHAVYHQSVVRRLTPVECERLQGFPDNWTQVPYRNKSIEQCPDGPRYAACGNSMAVPVMRWIAQRIEKHLNEISHLNN